MGGGKVVEYDAFRTGLTYRDVRRMLWSPSTDPTTWRYKRRHTVLGVWRSLKLAMYDEYLARNEVPASEAPY